MAKKDKTTTIHVRLPQSVADELKQAAPSEFESQSGLASRILIDWWKARRREKERVKK